MSNWIKCSERLPDEDGYYQVYPRNMGVSSWFSGGKFATESLYGLRITHWQLLPEPPEAE